MAEVGAVVPIRVAGALPVGIKDEVAVAAWPWRLLVIWGSGRQWTSHCWSCRHLCPVVVLVILSSVFIPPSLLWSGLPPLLSAVWHHHAAVSTTIKKTSRLDFASVCLWISKGYKYGEREKKSSVTPPFNIHIHYSPLPADGWFIRPIQNYSHTPTPSIPHTGVCRGPPLWPQRLMTCLKSFFHFQSLILFFHIFFIFLIHLLMQQARMCSRSSRSLKENTCNATPPRAYFGLSSPAFSKYLQLVSTISNPIKVLCPLKEPICVWHLPPNYLYMCHCQTSNPLWQLLSNPWRSSFKKHTWLVTG